MHAARQEQNSQCAAQRAAQDDEARRLAAELAHYPAAGALVAILRAQRVGPYRDHVIETVRPFFTDTVIDSGGAAPWAAVSWLMRGTKADYNRDQKPLAEGDQGAVYSGVHKPTRIPVALKQLRYGDEDALHRMRREISIGHLYGEHPDVMPVLDTESSPCSGSTSQLALPARFYERFGDHAVAVAKRVEFAATGLMPT